MIFFIMSKPIYYDSIPKELQRLKITQKEAAKLIASDQPITHWMIYGLANYLELPKPKKRRRNENV